MANAGMAGAEVAALVVVVVVVVAEAAPLTDTVRQARRKTPPHLPPFFLTFPSQRL